MTKRVGLYPGTFDPLTIGHVDIVERAIKLVDELVIGVAINRDKGPLFTLEERVAMVSGEMTAIARKSGVAIRVVPFESLLIHFAEQVKADIIIRGLRAVSDFEYEFQMVGMNQALNRDELAELAYGRTWSPFDRSLDIRISRLRRKIERDPARPEVILTVRGIGYRYEVRRNA